MRYSFASLNACSTMSRDKSASSSKLPRAAVRLMAGLLLMTIMSTHGLSEIVLQFRDIDLDRRHAEPA